LFIKPIQKNLLIIPAAENIGKITKHQEKFQKKYKISANSQKSTPLDPEEPAGQVSHTSYIKIARLSSPGGFTHHQGRHLLRSNMPHITSDATPAARIKLYIMVANMPPMSILFFTQPNKHYSNLSA